MVDGDFLEAAQINTDPVLQLAQRYRKPMAASGSQERDAPASGEFYLVRSVSCVGCGYWGEGGLEGEDWSYDVLDVGSGSGDDGSGVGRFFIYGPTLGCLVGVSGVGGEEDLGLW